MTELPFCAGTVLGRCIAPSAMFSQPYGKNNTLGSFSLFQALPPIQNESDAWKHWQHITCTHFDMAGYDVITYDTRVAKWHHSIFSLNLFHILYFDNKMSNFKRWWEMLTATQYYGNLLFISINVSSRKAVQKYYHIWYVKWCKC